MSSHELSTIQGLEDKHLRALARHGVTDVRGLVQADPEVIYRAMVNLRPRPSRDLVARWYESARSTLAETTDDVAEWQLVASFVVVFFQRRAGDTWERRVEAERTEVEPERNPQVWTGWETGPISDWMLGQLGQGNGAEPAPGDGTADEATEAAEEEAGAGEEGAGGAAAEEAGAAAAEEAGAAGAERPAAERPAAERPAAERPALRIDSAVIIDAAGRTDVVTAGAVAAGPPRELVAPVRVAFTVSGAPSGTRLWAVARVLRRDGPGWNARDPVAVPGSGEVEIDLSAVPAGEHDMGLMAWAPDAAAKPVSVRLPAITIRPG